MATLLLTEQGRWKKGYILLDESRTTEGFIPAETLVLNNTDGDNGTVGGTVDQPVLGLLVG